MSFGLAEGVRILERTPRVLDVLLRDLGEPWISANEGLDTWSPYDIVGHLIHGERTDWMERLRRILEHGVDKPFEPFDRFAQFEDSQGKTMAELLDEFAKLRADNLQSLRALELEDSQMDSPGLHPELGRVTLGQLLATWVTHDLGHLGQIARVLAKHNKDEVGPWAEYLPILSDRESSD